MLGGTGFRPEIWGERAGGERAFGPKLWGGTRLGGNVYLGQILGWNGLETLILSLSLPTAPQAKFFSYFETVLQWKTRFLSQKSLRLSPSDTSFWGGERPSGAKLWGGANGGGNGPSARDYGGEYEALSV